MKGKKVKELLKKYSLSFGGVTLAAVIAISGLWAADVRNSVPELSTFVDTEEIVEITEDEVPLAAPKVTTSTKTKKKTKKIKLKSASKKTYKKNGKTTTKKQTKNSNTSSAKTKTVTVTKTSVLNQYKKGSKINTQVTTTKTTVTKTVTPKTTSSAVASTAPAASANGVYAISSIAPKVDSRVASAYNQLGFTITVNSGVSYSGLFDARTRAITLRKADDTVYHELGHFVAFVAGNYDLSSEFKGIYARERSKYTASNKAYVLSSSSEYFAESFKQHTLNPAALKAKRPETYNAMVTALSKVTSTQVDRIWNVYKRVWV